MTKNDLTIGTMKLSSAKVLSQALSFLILPILTRIYPPESFGALSLFISTASILSIIATLNYDVAITATQSDEEATATLLGTWVFASTFSLGVLILTLFISKDQYNAIGLLPLYPYRYLISLSVWVMALFSALNYYQLRTQNFGFIAKVGIARSLSQAATNLAAGFLKFLGVGLLAGDLIKNFIAAAAYAYSERSKIIEFLIKPNPDKRISKALMNLIQFPTYGLPSDLIITLGVALPALFISKVWSPAELGFFLVAQKIYDIPLTLVGEPMGRVFLSESMRLNQSSPTHIYDYFKHTTRKLLLLSVTTIPLVVTAFYYLSEPVLGNSWGEAGKIALSMLPLAMARFITSPISQISAVIKKQNVEFYVSLLRLVLVLGVFSCFAYFKTNLYDSLLIYSLASFAMYMVFYIVYFYLVRQHHIETSQVSKL